MEMDVGARRAERSDLLDHAVRFGLVAYGLMHLVVGWIAVQLVFGQRTDEASGTGALHELAQQPFGEVLVWAVAVGMLLLLLWRVLEVLVGERGTEGLERWRKRAVSAGKACVYGFLGFTAMRIALGAGGSSGSSGSGSGSGSSEETMTAKVLAWPIGPWLVGAAGAVIIGIAVAHLWRGWTASFLDDLDVRGRVGTSGRAYEVLGRVGYAAKGIAFGVVGGLVVWAAVTHDPKKSAGLDEALREVLQQPFGRILLLAVAVGLACYGLFCFAQARHLDR
jgi:hypothetical protein